MYRAPFVSVGAASSRELIVSQVIWVGAASRRKLTREPVCLGRSSLRAPNPRDSKYMDAVDLSRSNRGTHCFPSTVHRLS